jgi:poly(3-hydroxybutyrate) depolymerase
MQRGDGAQALAAAAAAKVSSLGVRLLPARRWSNATSEGDPLRAIESTETDAPDVVAFIRDMAACVRDGLRVGISDRVYLAGWSQGSKLASALVCAPQLNGAQGGGF